MLLYTHTLTCEGVIVGVRPVVTLCDAVRECEAVCDAETDCEEVTERVTLGDCVALAVPLSLGVDVRLRDRVWLYDRELLPVIETVCEADSDALCDWLEVAVGVRPVVTLCEGVSDRERL